VVLSVDSPESWTRVVPTRALAVEILGSGHGPGENTVHLGHGFAREYAAAMRYGCRHGEDLELQAAVLRAFLEHEDWQGDPHSEAFGASLDCVRGIARSSVPPRLRFIAMLQNRREAPRAAQLLADTPEPDAQEAIAQVLAPLLDTASSASEGGPDVDALRSQLAWTLARITTLRRDASPLVVETLVHAATQSELPATRPSIVYAIRALTMLQAIEAGNALRRAAAGTCAEPIAQWPTTFVDWPGADAETATHPIACWAQAALTERTRLYGEDRLQVTH
jgi:hypothetical protein